MKKYIIFHAYVQSFMRLNGFLSYICIIPSKCRTPAYEKYSKFMKYKVYILLFILLWLPVRNALSQPAFELKTGTPLVLIRDASEQAVVHTAIELFCRDYQEVFSAKPRVQNALTDRTSSLLVGTLGESDVLNELKGLVDLSAIAGKHEAFLLQVISLRGKPMLIVAGSDKRGTAYGLLEVSRLMGVSPWEWWADVRPSKRQSFHLDASFRTCQSPSVAYRGIFINDEDWGLTPWSGQTYEPTTVKGEIGPGTHARIFELLLRLRANTFWPAMHECSVPFYCTSGNKEMADKYGIFLGTSHCEPMMRNTNGEWKRTGKGDYDYVNNRAAVISFWEQRVKEVAGSDNIYTLGMRGVHDGKMNGAHTIAEQKAVLVDVLKEQRQLLSHYVNTDVTKVPQVFIPYKEVLDIYNAGLQVPDDVTLMWCDDNYGYIHHLPTVQERARKGGNGVYYHVSYWGRPHDYLWLSTTHPSLVHTQMKQAYEHGIQQLWILNVGDIKPAEYQTELFLDMAWNIEEVNNMGTTAHLKNWLIKAFGTSVATQITPVMQEYYRLAYICKPEFLGHTRVEEKDPAYKIITDLPWSEQEIRERLAAYELLSTQVENIEKKLTSSQYDAYFQLVKYPVQAAAQMNKKLLVAQLARHKKADWNESDAAYDSIASLTDTYNCLGNGKWNRMIDFRPRQLPVFQRVAQQQVEHDLPAGRIPLYLFNGTDYTASSGEVAPCEGLGYQGQSLLLNRDSSIDFSLTSLPSDSIEVEVRLLPNHPVEGNRLRFSLSINGQQPVIFSYQTEGRSEEWKQNVLRNQAIRKVKLPVGKEQIHSIRITAMDKGVVVDQVAVY